MNDGSRAPVGFRPASRRRNRLAAGLVLAAIAIGGNVLVYASLNDTTPAVQVARDVPAGELITSEMLRTVDVNVDSSVNIVPGGELSSLLGRYAKVRLVSGSLVTREAIQPDPLLAAGNAVVAINVADGELPIGLRERVPVRLVITDNRSADPPTTRSVDGRVVGLPQPSSNGLGNSVSIEVADTDASAVAAAERVRVVLLVPSPDPAATGAGS